MRSTRLARVRLGTILFIPLLALSACGDAPDTERAPAPGDPPPAAPSEEVRSPMFQASIALRAVEGSGVTGEAVALHDADLVSMVVELEGLPAEGQYQVRVGQGTCASGGPTVAELNPVLGLADGTGTSTTTLEADVVPTDEAQFIEVLTEGDVVVACGNIIGHGDA